MNGSPLLDIENPFNIVKLVDNIKRHPCLYDTTLPDYSRRDATELAWSKVAEEINGTVIYCKKKWKNLRTVYLRKLRKDGDSFLDPKKRPYYLRDRMSFLLPFIKGPRFVSSIDEFPVIDAEEDQEAEEEDYSQEQIDESASSNNPSEYASINVKIESVQEDREPKKRRHYQIEDYDPLNVLSPHIQENIEARKMFVLSLLPEINALSEEQMKRFKRKVLELIDDITFT